MNSNELHIAAKQITQDFGEDIICTNHFLNILADYSAYKTIPASKPIMTELIKTGFGKFLYDLKQNKDEKILEKCYTHRKEFLSEGKYRADVTEYVYASLLYALGLIQNISEPKVKNPFSADAASTPEATARQQYVPKVNLRKTLELLQQEYLDLLKQIVVPQDDGDGVASGYFDYATLVKMYVVEEKIRMVCERLGYQNKFCQEQKDKVLAKYNTNMRGQQLKLQGALKKQYIATFDSYHSPKGKELKGYFDDEILAKQEDLETQIKYLCQCLNEDLDWCEKEKNNFLDQCAQKERRRKSAIIGTAVSGIAAVVAAIFVIGIYINSLEAQAQFENTFSEAAGLQEKGDLESAVTMYSKAEDDYKGSWRNGSIKAKAHQAASVASDQIFNEALPKIEAACNEKNYIDAYLALKALPDNLVLEGESWNKYQSILSQVEPKVDEAIKEETENLLKQIFLSGGKLSAKSMDRLNKSLQLKPDDYWLNFIKNKK